MLRDIINTLNAIEVHGKNNIAMLLGCINALEKMEKEIEDGRQEN